MKKYNFKYWAPLINFKTDQENFSITEKVLIRVASKREQDILSGLQKKWTNVRVGKFLLEITLEKDEPEPEYNFYAKEARDQIEKAITIFRLFKGELVGFNLIVGRLSEQEIYAYHAVTYFHYNLWTSPESPLSKRNFVINRTDVEAFQSFFDEFGQISFQPFELAIEYFNKSYIEPYTPRDSFLDLMVALENLYLKGITQELVYRLCLRISYLLGQNYEKRKTTFDLMKDAYEKRSKIVHGEKVSKLTDQQLLETRELTRQSLKIFLKNPQIIDELDEIIFRGAIP